MAADHWLRRPTVDLDDARFEAFEDTFQQILEADGGQVPEPHPTWAFLCWLADAKGLLLHGSPDPDIDTFEPRTPHDRSADDYSKQTAVFAAGDGIWAMFYAVLDRRTPGMRFLNGALQFADHTGRFGPMRYFFSVTKGALAIRPWRQGTVYVLPREGFTRQEPYLLGGQLVLEPHWASPAPVKPVARVTVSPDEFPFLDEVREHDPERVDAAAQRDPDGFPWL